MKHHLTSKHIRKGGNAWRAPASMPQCQFLDPEEPYLRELAAQEHLEELWALGRDEWESQRIICSWFKRQFVHSVPYPHPPANALIMMHWVRSGRSGIYCAMFSSLFVQG